MSAWLGRILDAFAPDLARFWIAVDPDHVLLDERILAELRGRGFELLPFEDPIVFRAEYEERYRGAWDGHAQAPAPALVLHLRAALPDALPWDYLRQARTVHLSLAHVFPHLSYGVVRQLDARHLETLFTAHQRYAAQPLGETATKDFILTHCYRLAPHLVARPEDLWRELLRLHRRDLVLPPVLVEHLAQILTSNDAFARIPVGELLSSKAQTLRLVQEGWQQFLIDQGLTGPRVGEAIPILIPFEHPDVRGLVDSMFLDGTLRPLELPALPAEVPDWIRVGIVADPGALCNLVTEGLKALTNAVPGKDASHRDWGRFAQGYAEVLARFHRLDSARAQDLQAALTPLQHLVDRQLLAWLRVHYADLPSLPAARAPVMVHQIPHFLALRRAGGEDRVALVVLDGLALDQWVVIRDYLIGHWGGSGLQPASCTGRMPVPQLAFAEGSCFAWLPTLTAVSRQALFAGLRPREFADSLTTTDREPVLWGRFWADQGLRPGEVLYRKGLRRVDQLDALGHDLARPSIKVAGIVVDTVDAFVHGADILGKAGIASQVRHWCESGFVERMFGLLLDQGFACWLTADHGNCEAVGTGRPAQGVVAETRGERVRVYRSALLRSESAQACPGTVSQEVPALPADFLPLLAGERSAFVTPGEALVSHGGCSLEELIVPFVKVSDVR